LCSYRLGDITISIMNVSTLQYRGPQILYSIADDWHTRLPDFPGQNTGDFCRSVHRSQGLPNPILAMCLYNYKLCPPKNFTCLTLSLTLSNLNQFFKIFRWKRMKFAIKNYTILPTVSHLTLGMLLPYLKKLRVQICCSYGKKANTVHF